MNSDIATRQLLRAVRGSRSQVAFSRRLGYRGNVAADWEAGRRTPSAADLLRAAGRVGIDVRGAFASFHPGSASAWDDQDGAVAGWLTALAGNTPLQEIAGRTGLSRYAVGRMLNGRTQVRVPDWLALVEALTGRCGDLVAALVPIAEVPELEAGYRHRQAARDLAFEAPWTAAVLRVIETTAWAERTDPGAAALARCLGIPAADAEDALARLIAVGAVERHGDRWVAGSPLSVGTRGEPSRVAALKAHWGRVAAHRSAQPTDDDLFSYNLMSLSRSDLARIRELQRSYFREVRQIVAASQPEETVAMLWLGLMSWDPER